MADHAGFLEAIGDEPDDDTPRLIYADWLEEHGEPERAEFIRLQCRAASLPWDEERDALEDRADDLLQRCENVWLGRLAEVLTDWRFERGFLDFARLPCEQLRDRVDDLVRAGPACRVRLYQQSHDSNLSAVMRWPELERITGLELPEMLTESACDRVARSPFVKRLRYLDVSGTVMIRTDSFPLAALGGLASNPAYAKLRSLCLDSRQVNGRGMKALASPQVLTDLRSLSLSNNPINDKGIQILAKSAWLAHLTTLDLQATDVTAGSVGYLAEAPHLRDLSLPSRKPAGTGNSMLARLAATGLLGRLERLALRFEARQRTGLGALVGFDGPARMKELYLNGSGFGYLSLTSFASARLLETVETLHLRSCRLEPGELPTLSGSPLLPRLRALCLSSTNLEDTHAEYFASAGYVSRLRFLDLSRTWLRSAGLTAMLDGLEGNLLRSLKLADNPLQDAGLERLAAAPGLGRLRELDLSRTGATAEGVHQLLASMSLPRLRVLRLSGTDLEGLNVEELLKSPVVTGLRLLDLSSTRRLTGDDIGVLQAALGRRVNLQYAGDDC